MFKKLTEEQVLAIRKEYRETKITQTELAKKYKVCKGSISHIVNGRNWAQLPGTWN